MCDKQKSEEGRQVIYLHLEFPVEGSAESKIQKSYGVTAAFVRPEADAVGFEVGLSYRSKDDNSDRKRGNTIALGRLEVRPTLIPLKIDGVCMSVADAIKFSLMAGEHAKLQASYGEKITRIPRWLPLLADLM